jgi:hypothetical protein
MKAPRNYAIDGGWWFKDFKIDPPSMDMLLHQVNGQRFVAKYAVPCGEQKPDTWLR